ncbi:MAG: hypothetical protein ABIH72_01405 [archaeon]
MVLRKSALWTEEKSRGWEDYMQAEHGRGEGGDYYGFHLLAQAIREVCDGDSGKLVDLVEVAFEKDKTHSTE